MWRPRPRGTPQSPSDDEEVAISAWDGDPTIASVLASSRLCYLAVQTQRGPHVTPHVFAESGGRLWFTTSRDARKVRALRKNDRASVVVQNGHTTLIAEGSVRVLDILDPASIAGSIPEVVRSGRAMLRLALKSIDQLIGYAMAVGDLPAAWVPPNRAVLAFRPAGVLTLNEHWQPLTSAGSLSPADGEDPGVSEVCSSQHANPPVLPDTVTGTHSGAIAWQSGRGPLAAPASLESGSSLATVPSWALRRLDPNAPAVAFATQVSNGLRPIDKHGFLLRGRGRIVGINGDKGSIAIETKTLTHWSGFRSETSTIDERQRS